MLPSLTTGTSRLLLGLSIVAGTLVSEDATTLAAAGLAAQGAVDPAVAAVSCALGIWVGDLGLYGMGRGARLFPFAQRWLQRVGRRYPLARVEQHLSRDGWKVLGLSRFIPGTRIAAFVSAGVLRMPAGLFAGITAICAAVWVALIFWSAKSAATLLDRRLAGIVLATAALALLARSSRAQVTRGFRRLALLAEKYSRWEFWPAWLFYPPVAAMCLWLTLRFRGFTATSANPGISTGGIVGESKADLLAHLAQAAPEFTAAAQLIPPGEMWQRMHRLRRHIEKQALGFPIVLKPDQGQRGAGFRVVHSLDDAADYFARVTAPVVVQRYVAYEKEAGIFYYRHPGSDRGEIFAITRKEFPAVIGDGRHTLQELVEADPRARLIAATYRQRHRAAWQSVIPDGERRRLVEAGNHCQGCIFRDGIDLYSTALRERIDAISKSVPGFYVGRYDVRYRCDEELRRGEAFTIIELNGAASEATSIYDPETRLLDAYRTLYRQWELVFTIGAANRARGYRSETVFDLWREWRRYVQYSQAYPAAD